MQKLFDFIHNNGCGEDGVVHKFYATFYTPCPCCHWYRGFFFAMVLGVLVGLTL